MDKILELALYIINFIVYESFYFTITEKYYCKKNKGKCENCKCWSCRKPYYLKKGEKENGK